MLGAPPVKVYAEVLPATLGRAMYRINAELRRHAPAEVAFTKDPEEADLQILDVVGGASLDHLRRADYVLLQHTFLSADPAFWLPHFQGAKLVMSYHDLPALMGTSEFAFYRAPWGVDSEVFVDLGIPRDRVALTSGYDAGGEAITEFFAAAARLGERVVQIGAHLGEFSCVDVLEGISDPDLVVQYNRARYVSGLRRAEGFELPVIEGLACGARPICFDTPAYRYWFADHAVLVPELPCDDLVEALVGVLSQPPQPVSAEERAQVLERFDWKGVFEPFWCRLLQ